MVYHSFQKYATLYIVLRRVEVAISSHLLYLPHNLAGISYFLIEFVISHRYLFHSIVIIAILIRFCQYIKMNFSSYTCLKLKNNFRLIIVVGISDLTSKLVGHHSTANYDSNIVDERWNFRGPRVRNVLKIISNMEGVTDTFTSFRSSLLLIKCSS